MLSTYHLPLSFDPGLLQRDLAALLTSDWVPHFNKPYYKGDWSGIALRAVGGDPGRLYPDMATHAPYVDTPLLERCPYFRAVLAELAFPHEAVRLLRLAAGSSIREHKDYDLGYDDGEIRLHIPILTNPDVEFILGGERVEMRPGECWYMDFNLPHSVVNNGATDRIHLVVDGHVNDWVRAIFAPAASVG
jgi:hypothetical protein